MCGILCSDNEKWVGKFACLTLHGDLVLFTDTFSRWMEPDIPRAALRVLHAAGYAVHAAGPDQRDGLGRRVDRAVHRLGLTNE